MVKALLSLQAVAAMPSAFPSKNSKAYKVLGMVGVAPHPVGLWSWHLKAAFDHHV